MRGTKPLGLSLVALLAVVVALTIGTSSALAVAAPTAVDLIAGQHQVVGTVTVTPLSSTSLKVEYKVTSGCITETHVAVASTAAGIPQTSRTTRSRSVPEGRVVHPCCQTTAGPYVFTGLTPGNNVVAAHRS